MAEPTPEDVTLNTLHEDVNRGFADLKGEVRGGFADLKQEVQTGFSDLKAGIADVKVTLVAGFRNMPTREDSQEMIRLLRENNRIQEERFTQLDVRIRDQHLEIQQVLRAVAESQRILIEGQRTLVAGQRDLLEGQRALHEDIRALIARIDALIKGRGDGSPPPTP